MSKKLQPIDNSTSLGKPKVIMKTIKGYPKSPNATLEKELGSGKLFEDNLKDYDSLLKYCTKLIDENKQLLTENNELRAECEENLTLNIELLEENQKLKKEKDKLVDDSLSVIEYNEQLVKDKDQSDGDSTGLKEKIDIIVQNLIPEAISTLKQKYPELSDLQKTL